MNKSIALESVFARILPILIGLTVIFIGYLGVNWTFGNMIAQHADTQELAQTAIQMSPSDPQTYYTMAGLKEKTFLPDDLPIALANYEKAVSVSPNDFRLWISLSKSREQMGDRSGAIAAMKKAQSLAPNYSQIHWFLGNQLLRDGKDEEAYHHIREAVKGNSVYAAPAVNMTWQIFEGDVDIISQKIGDSVPIKAALAPFLAKQKRFDEALTFWNSVPDNEKSKIYKSNAESLLAALSEAKMYRQMMVLQNQTVSIEQFAEGLIYNGDFEKAVKPSGASIFDWQVSEGTQPQISLDGSQKRNGERSLILAFNSQTGQENRAVRQTVVVKSNKTYKFECFYKSELKAISGLKWEIADAGSGKILASTDETSLNNPNWSNLSAEFTTSADTQAVNIQLIKTPCKQSICPISGKIWFDDLILR